MKKVSLDDYASEPEEDEDAVEYVASSDGSDDAGPPGMGAKQPYGPAPPGMGAGGPSPATKARQSKTSRKACDDAEQVEVAFYEQRIEKSAGLVFDAMAAGNDGNDEG